MSTYSLDSLEKYSIIDAKSLTRPEVGCIRQLSCDNPEDRDKYNGEKDVKIADNIIKDKEFNESSFVAMTTNRDRDIVKLSGNAIIASGADVNREFCSSVEKLPTTLGTRTRFRTGRPVAKKFNVPRRSSSLSTSTSSSSSSSSSSSEFRHGASSLPKKRPDDVVGFMKANKKPGNVQPDVSDRSKKLVSYLELYLKRFGIDRGQCICTPVGSTTSIGDDRSDERSAMDNDSGVSLAVPGDERCDVGFQRPGLRLESRESCENRFCKGPDSFVTKEGRDDFSPGSLSDAAQPINRRTRVSYEPYDIEDYKSLSVPSADRSLGPDRNEMETKGEWLMRRRAYGDSVSALNRERILRRNEKLKNSRRTDSQKLPLYPASMDSQHPGPASKIEVMPKREENIIPAKSHSHREGQANLEQRESAGKFEKLSSAVRKKKSAPVSSSGKTETKASSRLISDLYETSSDTLDEESMHLKNLLQRHLKEKIMIDRLLKRGLCT